MGFWKYVLGTPRNYALTIVLEQFAKECELEEDDLRNAFPGEEPFRGLEKWIESKFETIEYATYLFEVADYVLEEYENGELDEED